MSVELIHIEKSYGHLRVLRDVSFTLESGRAYCLMGPSGAGKTTLLRVLLGLERADSGSVCGLSAGDASAVFQEDRLCSPLTPVENLALVMPGRASRRRLRALLAEILPENCLDKPVLQLSGGQRRRVSIVRALAFPGKIVVMDEPFTGLDTATRRTTIDFVSRWVGDRTLLVSTHGDEDAALLGAQKVQLADLMVRTAT
ncbi:MAG: ABC transporter ATP-binding protein [Berryella intestinalis]|uniref:ABC transporter ATP-binding protein n=1 Tax=Berryella intestinalis TaxID=1531429 RepID=UPI002A54E6EA|nr:ABC transporter ATP-binding protein [Berryella intestinalis]MDD7369993.1 ABC transporter ATP-binding protein [Berryella intestinalis]MDY3128620.1 ABC transporter ATP-binding protein [Berryella intestinalis]